MLSLHAQNVYPSIWNVAAWAFAIASMTELLHGASGQVRLFSRPTQSRYTLHSRLQNRTPMNPARGLVLQRKVKLQRNLYQYVAEHRHQRNPPPALLEAILVTMVMTMMMETTFHYSAARL